MSAQEIAGIKIERDALLAPQTSWQVGGAAEAFAEPRTIEEVHALVEWADEQKLAITILSGGTNVLVADSGVRGLVLGLSKLSGLTSSESPTHLEITCLAGTGKSELLKLFLKHRLAPALFLAGLPGDVGGGVAMNAGVGEMIHPREFVEITQWIEVLRRIGDKSWKVRRYDSSELAWSYRHCEGWKPGVIVRVGLRVPNVPVDDILQKVKDANRMRLSKQPLDMPSCGSVFVNSPGQKSGQLIESSGLKGFAIGGAQVSPKHANFIVNTGGATALQIDAVIQHVRKTVHAQHGVDLQTEVVYLGDWPGRTSKTPA